MWYQTRDSLTTLNKGLKTLKTKSGGGFPGWGDVLGGDFVLRGPKHSCQVGIFYAQNGKLGIF